MGISIAAKEAVRFIFKEPSMRRIRTCAVLGIGMVSAAIVANVVYRSSGFLLSEAFDLSVKSLRLPFVLSGLGIVALVIALAIKWYSQDWQAVKAHFRKNLLESQIPAAGALVIFFLYNLVYVVPLRIARDANAVQPPRPLFAIPSPNICVLDPGACRRARAVSVAKTASPVAPDPVLQLSARALKMADKLSNLHDQMESDLRGVWARRERDVQGSRPANGTQQEKDAHDAWVRSAWVRDEEEIRDSTAQTFRKCCQEEAIDLREKLMLEVPGVSSHEAGRYYSFVPIPGRPDLAGRSLQDYGVMATDLRNLAMAYQQKTKAKR
jgi:hypothetical protein